MSMHNLQLVRRERERCQPPRSNERGDADLGSKEGSLTKAVGGTNPTSGGVPLMAVWREGKRHIGTTTASGDAQRWSRVSAIAGVAGGPARTQTPCAPCLMPASSGIPNIASVDLSTPERLR